MYDFEQLVMGKENPKGAHIHRSDVCALRGLKTKNTMAIFHLQAKIIGRSTGKSAIAAAAYRAGCEIVDRRTGLVHDYTRKKGVDLTEIIAPAGAPDWVFDRAELWNRVEQSEKRKDSQLAREIEISIPRELPVSARFALVREYARLNFADEGMVADLAFHHAADPDHGNPHCHIMLTMRDLKADKFGNKNRDWNEEPLVEKWRENWADLANKYLAENYNSARIDHRSYRRQGIDKVPTKHLGAKCAAMEAKGIRTERGDYNRAVMEFNKLTQEINLEVRKPSPTKPEPVRPASQAKFSATQTLSAMPTFSGASVQRSQGRENDRVLPNPARENGRGLTNQVHGVRTETEARERYQQRRRQLAVIEYQAEALKEGRFNDLPETMGEQLETLRNELRLVKLQQANFDHYNSMPWYRKVATVIFGQPPNPPSRELAEVSQQFGEMLGARKQHLIDAEKMALAEVGQLLAKHPQIDPEAAENLALARMRVEYAKAYAAGNLSVIDQDRPPEVAKAIKEAAKAAKQAAGEARARLVESHPYQAPEIDHSPSNGSAPSI